MIGSGNTVLMNSPFGGLEKMKTVYFIGIGGIGMSAVARYFNSKGVAVSGYDKTVTALTKDLEESGISIHYEENVELIPKEADLVVYTPAVPADHRELVFYRNNGYRIVKRSEVLEWITQSSFNICIAGTHGKTTITTMIAHLLRDSGYGCNAFLGGISVNYGTNFWSHENSVCVIEADEYDRSFLKLSPDIAIITAMDADHLDIYGDAKSMEQAFIDFSHRIKPGGILISKYGLPRTKELNGERHFSYSLQNRKADVYGDHIKMSAGGYEFDIIQEQDAISELKLYMGGMHNVENAVAAIKVASSLGISHEKIRAAISSFKGVKRRFEYITAPMPGKGGVVFVDDYAHHPEELRALINGAMTLFAERRCTVIFQPHLYSRTRDLAEGFAEALDLADEVVLLPIYPAREQPIQGVNSEMILDKMKKKNKRVLTKEELIDWIKNEYLKNAGSESGELLITAGAGDIDTVVEPIRNLINKE